MEPIKLTLQVEAIDEAKIACLIFNESENNSLNFFIANSAISFLKENKLASVVRNNKHQLEKIIRSAIWGNVKVGQIINCVFITDFCFLKEKNFTRFIRIDRRNGTLDITTSESGFSEAYKIYADGSFNSDYNRSGYGGFIESPDGKQTLFSQSFKGGSNNLMELMAVTEGLRRLLSERIIQVHTDSRFVIRGLVQWVHFWKHNNWQTAYGRVVKYAEQWQMANNLCEDKCIEFKWIKGHSGNVEHDVCHQLAKSSSACNNGDS